MYDIHVEEILKLRKAAKDLPHAHTQDEVCTLLHENKMGKVCYRTLHYQMLYLTIRLWNNNSQVSITHCYHC